MKCEWPLKNEEKTLRYYLKNEKKNDGISNTFLKNQVNFQAYFEFQMEFLRLYFSQKTVLSAGGSYTENFWIGPSQGVRRGK